MWELDCEEGWAPKNWWFWTVVLEKTLESPLDCKEIQPVHPERDESWVFIGMTDVEAETPILWPPDVKRWLIGEDPDAGKDWGQEKRMIEDEMIGWHHWLDGHGLGWTPGVGDGQGGLACFGSWGCRVRHDWVTELDCGFSYFLIGTGPSGTGTSSLTEPVLCSKCLLPDIPATCKDSKGSRPHHSVLLFPSISGQRPLPWCSRLFGMNECLYIHCHDSRQEPQSQHLLGLHSRKFSCAHLWVLSRVSNLWRCALACVLHFNILTVLLKPREGGLSFSQTCRMWHDWVSVQGRGQPLSGAGGGRTCGEDGHQHPAESWDTGRRGPAVFPWLHSAPQASSSKTPELRPDRVRRWSCGDQVPIVHCPSASGTWLQVRGWVRHGPGGHSALTAHTSCQAGNRAVCRSLSWRDEDGLCPRG